MFLCFVHLCKQAAPSQQTWAHFCSGFMSSADGFVEMLRFYEAEVPVSLPCVKCNCVLFIALGINTHSSLRNFLQGLSNSRGWCLEGGRVQVQLRRAGSKDDSVFWGHISPGPTVPMQMLSALGVWVPRSPLSLPSLKVR